MGECELERQTPEGGAAMAWHGCAGSDPIFGYSTPNDKYLPGRSSPTGTWTAITLVVTWQGWLPLASCWVSPYGTALGPTSWPCGTSEGMSFARRPVKGTSLATILPRLCAALLGCRRRACLRCLAMQFGANFWSATRWGALSSSFSLVLDAPTGCEVRFCLASAKLSLLGSFGFLARSRSLHTTL